MPLARFNTLGTQATRALIGGDFALYRSAFWLPLSIEPRALKPYTLTTEADIETDFQHYHNAVSLNQVTDIVREVLDTVSIGPDKFEVSVRTDILCSTGRVLDPYINQFVLQLRGLEWRISGIRNALGHINWTLGKALDS